MNKETIEISSTSSNVNLTFNEIELNDHTELTLNLENIYSKIIPIFAIIDWGDGKRENIDNNLFKFLDRQNINIFNPNPLLNEPYTHEYSPSGNSLYTVYTLQILIYYSNSDYSTFTLPIKVITDDYHESIGDLKILNVNILPDSNNPKEYQLQASINKQLIEFRDDD